MNYEELLCNYNTLLSENQKLQDEIKALKEQLGITELALEAGLPFTLGMINGWEGDLCDDR